jgi:hypothetical protein
LSEWNLKLIGAIETACTMFDAGEERTLIIEIEPSYVRIRAKGMREVYDVSWNKIYTLGALNAADEKRALRRAGRKGNAAR